VVIPSLTIQLTRLLKDELKPTEKEIDEQFEKKKLKQYPYNILKDKNANLGGLAKDVVKQKFARYVDKRVEKAKISDTKIY